MAEAYWQLQEEVVCLMQTIINAVCNLNRMFTEEELKTDRYRLTDRHKLAAKLKR